MFFESLARAFFLCESTEHGKNDLKSQKEVARRRKLAKEDKRKRVPAPVGAVHGT